MSTLLGLPPELIKRVMGLVPPCEMERCALVCVALNDVCDEPLNVVWNLWEEGKHKAASDMVIAAIMCYNPELKIEELGAKRSYNEDGTLQFWNLALKKIITLPREIGTVRTTGSFYVNDNIFSVVPASCRLMQIGGTLMLQSNCLKPVRQSLRCVLYKVANDTILFPSIERLVPVPPSVSCQPDGKRRRLG